ncbi:hypothetical protein SLA2020_071120 [Shorea laevis]
MDCIKGSETWNMHNGLKLQPPPFRRTRGRRKIKRIKSKHEIKKLIAGQVKRISKKGVKMTGSLCGKEGHNKRTCQHKDDPTFKREMPKLQHKLLAWQLGHPFGTTDE